MPFGFHRRAVTPTPPSLHAGHGVWVPFGFHRRAVASRRGIHPSGPCNDGWADAIGLRDEQTRPHMSA
ncbi:MAG: hypothetical protein ACK5GU_14410, partial [Chloroflexota bacterium]